MLTKNTKLGHKGTWPRSRDLLLDFGTPLLSPVRMKLVKFCSRIEVGYTKQKKEKLEQKGGCLWHVTSCCCLKITKDGITSQHSDISAVCSEVMPYFVIFAVFYV